MLVTVNHPLGDPRNRPLGLSFDELQAKAAELLRYELPADLAQFWEWTGGLGAGGTLRYREGVEPLGYFGKLLPGEIRLNDLGASIAETRRQNEIAMANGDTISGFESWLEFAHIEKSWTFHAELAEAGGGEVTPVWVYEMHEFPFGRPVWRFESIAEFVDVQTRLVRDGWFRNFGISWRNEFDLIDILQRDWEVIAGT